MTVTADQSTTQQQAQPGSIEALVAQLSAQAPQAAAQQEQMVLVPAGWLGNLAARVSGKVGGAIGEAFGNRQAGQAIGQAASPLLKLIPFSAGPEAAPQQQAAQEEQMVLVPAGFLGGLVGSALGKLGGGVIGDLFGNKKLGKQIGEGAGGLLGGTFIPFSAGPEAGQQQPAQEEQMVLVPAGWLGNLAARVSGTVGGAIGEAFGNRRVGQAVGEAASPLLKLIPFSAGPEAAQQQQAQQEQMVLVPAGWLGDALSSVAGAAGSAIGDLFGDAETGRDIGDAAAPFLKFLPFEAGAPTAPAQQAQEQMVVVPAGFLTDLIAKSRPLQASIPAKTPTLADLLATTVRPGQKLPF